MWQLTSHLSHRNEEQKSNCFSINLLLSRSKLYLNPAGLLTVSRIDSVIVSSVANQKTVFVIEHKQIYIKPQ